MLEAVISSLSLSSEHLKAILRNFNYFSVITFYVVAFLGVFDAIGFESYYQAHKVIHNIRNFSSLRNLKRFYEISVFTCLNHTFEYSWTELVGNVQVIFWCRHAIVQSIPLLKVDNSLSSAELAFFELQLMSLYKISPVSICGLLY